MTIAMDVEWSDGAFFKDLQKLREDAAIFGIDQPHEIALPDKSDRWVFNVKPFGAGGYQWLLVSGEYTLKIGNWFTPKQRPSIMIDVRSETLWNFSPPRAVERIRKLLESVGAKPVAIKVSRVDLCVDVLIQAEWWGLHLIDQIVSRAIDVVPHLKRGTFTGVTIGSGVLLARLYDKPLEIRQKSHKFWMYGIWGIKSVPDELRVIRVEFQHRRENLTSMGVDSVGDLFQLVENLWSYDTQSWLKVQEGGEHHTQRHTLAWWEAVQAGFCKSLEAHPTVKAKAIRAEAERLLRRAMGDMAAWIALDSQARTLEDGTPIPLENKLERLVRFAKFKGMDGAWLLERVRQKLAKYQRGKVKYAADVEARQDAGVNSTQPINWWTEEA